MHVGAVWLLMTCCKIITAMRIAPRTPPSALRYVPTLDELCIEIAAAPDDGVSTQALALLDNVRVSELRARLDQQPSDAWLAAEVGTLLFDLLFPGPARKVYGEWASMAPADRRRCLRLRLPAQASDLIALPWELMHDHDQLALLQRGVTVVRDIVTESSDHLPFTTHLPLRVLMTTADTPPPIDMQRQIQAVKKGLGAKDRARVTVSEDLTVTKLQRRLEHEYDVWHFVGHGDVGDDGDPYLVLKDGTKVEAFLLSSLLVKQNVRLAVLSTCDSGAIGRAPLQSLGPVLRAAGIPAVVAMQRKISDESARTFASAFYRALAAGRSLHESVDAGRVGLLELGGRQAAAWWVPVLYTSEPGGVLVQITGQKRPKRLYGRSDTRAEIAARLRQGQSVALVGPPGIGKTALLDDLARTLARERRVFMHDCRETAVQPSLLRRLATWSHEEGRDQLLRRLNAPARPLDDGEINILEAVSDTIHALARRRPLFCFDNADESRGQEREIIRLAVSLSKRCDIRVILVSHSAEGLHWLDADQAVAQVDISSISAAAAAEWLAGAPFYLDRDLAGLVYDHAAGITQIAEALAAWICEAVGTYGRRQQPITRAAGEEALRQGFLEHFPETHDVSAVLTRYYAMLGSLDQLCLKILLIAGPMTEGAVGAIARRSVEHPGAHGHDGPARISLDHTAVRQALTRLDRLRIVTADGGSEPTYALRRVFAAAFDRQAVGWEEGVQIRRLIAEHAEESDPVTAIRHYLVLRDWHAVDRIISRIPASNWQWYAIWQALELEASTDGPERRAIRLKLAELRAIFGYTHTAYDILYPLAAARAHLEPALRLRYSEALAYAVLLNQRMPDSEREEALQLAMRVCDEAIRLVKKTGDVLAVGRLQLRRLTLVEAPGPQAITGATTAQYRRLLRQCDRLKENGQVDRNDVLLLRARTLHNLGRTPSRPGATDQELEAWLTESISIREELLHDPIGAVEPRIALGNLYIERGRYTAAEPILRQCLATCNRYILPFAAYRLRALEALGIMYACMGRPQEAIAALQEAHEGLDRAAGPGEDGPEMADRLSVAYRLGDSITFNDWAAQADLALRCGHDLIALLERESPGADPLEHEYGPPAHALIAGGQRLMGQLEAAGLTLAAAWEAQRQSEFATDQAKFRLEQAKVALGLGHLADARHFAEQADQLAALDAFEPVRARVRVLIARIDQHTAPQA